MYLFLRKLVGVLIFEAVVIMSSRSQFENRLATLGRKHSAMSRGYKTHIQHDGLIVVKPRRAGRGVSFKAVLLAALGFFAFKAFLLASLGPDAYSDRISGLETGTIFEQGGAWVMQIDPATQAIADFVGPVLRG